MSSVGLDLTRGTNKTMMNSVTVLLLICYLLLLIDIGYSSFDTDENAVNKLQFEAAFQGRCDRGSPCEQLCYDLHDGMYECDCNSGFQLHEDGYSCYELNSTISPSESDINDNKLGNVLYQKGAEVDIGLSVANGTLYSNFTLNSTSVVDSLTTDFETTMPTPSSSTTTEHTCYLDCGPGGGCVLKEPYFQPTCLCPLGKGGDRCDKDVEIRSPRFSGSSWLALPTLRGAYKHVQITLELRPEAYDGIFFLTGERDDMQGDFMALLLFQGFVEFRFDCGSGIGILRSEETVLLNQWNHISLFRHRWDAWLQLNNGKHVQGRSKGLFSRITFREPLFIGGTGNITSLSEKLPVSSGIKGCLRNLQVNDNSYKFALEPKGEALKGYGVEECTADRCSRIPCQHGGKCLQSEGSAVCLCPLGFSGDLCEIRVDLHVPAFNGSSYLRYRGLGDDTLTWLDLEIVLKPNTPNGLVLYNGHRVDGFGDFMALYLNQGFVEFMYDLGTGFAIVRSDHKVSLGEWHEIKVSRTGRLAILEVDNQIPAEVMSPGAFTQLSLPQNLFLGGVPNFGIVSLQVRVRSAFTGCIQKVVINGRPVSILAEALGGVNVDNCPHPCVARPCGKAGDCIPQLEYFTCQCKPGFHNEQLCVSRSPPSFHGKDSFVHFNDTKTLLAFTSDPFSINVRCRLSSTLTDGLLLWISSGPEKFLSLGVEQGSLVLRFVAHQEEVVVLYNTTIVTDNLWHRIKAVRSTTTGLLLVDNGPAVTTQFVQSLYPHRVLPGLYVGGIPDARKATNGKYVAGIKGCIADLVLNTDHHLNLVDYPTAQINNVDECDV
ncbi:pikachurin [Agrilus planipennis]|uniref:Pikachurin n=1 Tax=Agrilus planipennis TaxID=224129 RepID=A0A1W4WX31_AGRPL|nr:pikachurin [Agrilus planipennis]